MCTVSYTLCVRSVIHRMCTVSYILDVYTRGSPVEVKTPTHRNPMGHSTTPPPPPALSLNSILPPHSSHCARQHSARVLKILLFQFLTCIKLRDLKLKRDRVKIRFWITDRLRANKSVWPLWTSRVMRAQ